MAVPKWPALALILEAFSFLPYPSLSTVSNNGIVLESLVANGYHIDFRDPDSALHLRSELHNTHSFRAKHRLQLLRLESLIHM